MRLRIARKEAKETHFWLKLMMEANPNMKQRMVDLFQESLEIKKILSTIIAKLERKNRESK